jgi:hypothetical protein
VGVQVGNTYSHNLILNSPHNCITGGGNDPPPFSNGTGAAIPSGSGSECDFFNNTLDTCAYECQDCVRPVLRRSCPQALLWLSSIAIKFLTWRGSLRGLVQGAFYTCGQQGQAWVNRGNKLRSTVFRNIGIISLDTPYRWASWWPTGQIGAYFGELLYPDHDRDRLSAKVTGLAQKLGQLDRPFIGICSHNIGPTCNFWANPVTFALCSRSDPP